MVCGVIGEGSSLDMQASWNNPFENSNPGSFFDSIGGLLQLNTDYTSRTLLNSAQVWVGNRPAAVNLSLSLYAISDAAKEVEAAITALKQFYSPEVNSSSPIGDIVNGNASVGRIPSSVTLNIGRNFIYKDMIITSISEPFDETRDSNGNRLSAMINITMESDRMLNQSEIASLSGQS